MGLITKKSVEDVGLVLALGSAGLLMHGAHRAVVLAAIGVYLLDRALPEAFNFVSKFAKPTTWPGYVALGVAALAAAHRGGCRADFVVAGLLTIGVGRLFDVLY